MAQQDVIYPSAPLLIVDRQWRRKKRGNQVDTLAFTINRPSAKKDITISILGQRNSATDSRTKTSSHPAGSKNINFQFVENHSPSSLARPKNPPRRSGKRQTSTEKPPATTVVQPVDPQPSPFFSIAPIVPKSSTTLYAYAGSNIPPDAQELLNYYVEGIGATFYPLQDVLSFDINPVKAAWMPMAMDHEVFLNSALLCADVHKVFMETQSRDVQSNRFFQQVINLVKSRIGKGYVDDAVVGAVSCLVLIEHCLDHQDSASVHHTGLGEIVRLRGGIQTMRDPLQMKIIRADLLPCVDKLQVPKMPRLRRTVPSLKAIMFPDDPENLILTKALGTSNLSLHISPVMLALFDLSSALEYASQNLLTIPCRAFDEDTMGIQYDLLLVPRDGLNDMDITIRSAALLYLKALTRVDPVPNDGIVDPMMDAIKVIEVNASNATFLFWSNYMGAMFSTDRSKRIWFREELAIFRRSAQVHSWAAAEKMLKEISWVTKVFSDTGSSLWTIIETLSVSNLFTQEPTPPLTPPSPITTQLPVTS